MGQADVFHDIGPLRPRLLMLLGVAAFLAGWPGLADGQPRSTVTSEAGGLLQTVAGAQCVQAVDRLEGDVLVNLCNECRIAHIEYQRRGEGIPLSRTYRVSEKGKVELSFKGSGRARVVGDAPCEPEKTEAVAADAQNCAKLGRRKNGEAAIVNTCAVCRGIVLERIAANGRRERETMALSPHGSAPVPQRGAAHVRIVSELQCTR